MPDHLDDLDDFARADLDFELAIGDDSRRYRKRPSDADDRHHLRFVTRHDDGAKMMARAYTMRELARRLDMAKSTLHRHVSAGTVPGPDLDYRTRAAWSEAQARRLFDAYERDFDDARAVAHAAAESLDERDEWIRSLKRLYPEEGRR